MSATDDFRSMLDERGVKWVDTGDGSTFIPEQAATNVAWDVNTWPSGKDMGDCLWVQNRHPLTPEQAIEATLGRGECRNVYEKGHFKCSECGHYTQTRMVYRDGMPADPRFCPWCGRKVVE